ncbi:hypothetical protein NDU88_004302 [Pleurodeles waltl]|uniref:Uncharacterized protein n=1 Tax=Pleurodeles waltl TaxID=8319 RepID=A0AAV7LU86_PLEWA|nr:hypothetical protein NDU88_004302 [Pleurodeles waltl]
MGKDRATQLHATNTITQYTTLRQSTHQLTGQGDDESAGCPLGDGSEPSQADLLAVIQGTRMALEFNIETVSIDVNLLRADLRKVANKVETAEGNILVLQGEVVALKRQMAQMTTVRHDLEWRVKMQKDVTAEAIFVY